MPPLAIPAAYYLGAAALALVGWQYYRPGGTKDQIIDSLNQSAASSPVTTSQNAQTQAGALSGSTAQPCSTCDPCGETRGNMFRLMDELKKRHEDMRIDKFGLYMIRNLPPPANSRSPTSGTWYGHQQQFENKQQSLKSQMRKYANDNCGAPPDSAQSWVNARAPDSPRIIQ